MSKEKTRFNFLCSYFSKVACFGGGTVLGCIRYTRIRVTVGGRVTVKVTVTPVLTRAGTAAKRSLKALRLFQRPGPVHCTPGRGPP